MSITNNELIHESSPYLLQHAHNPVAWKAWYDKTLNLAQSENKLLIVSIGYATCHWCHVMESESFEDKQVAEVMNKYFISIKVDREEHPDIDHIYMDAIHLISGRGGWPLNIVALPDGRPIWGTMYLPKDRWVHALNEIANLWKNQPEKIVEYAEHLTIGVKQNDLISSETDKKTTLTVNHLKQLISRWKSQFDHEWGGMNRAPKFPQPTVYQFLLKQAWLTNDTKLLDFVELSLEKMAFGGIYDHIRGGFARYSTDLKWHIPHFEKMLYDNAQLVSLYADAYRLTKNKLFKTVVEETLDFVINEMYDENKGGFYSALDADSINKEGVKEEGAYYTWTKETLESILEKDDFELFSDYYNINSFGYWEHGKYVLMKKFTDSHFSEIHKLKVSAFQKHKSYWKDLLKREQKNRSRPVLDDKSLTAWNALMIKGFLDAYKALGTTMYLNIAQKGVDFVLTNLVDNEVELYRSFKNGKKQIHAFLDDYALLIEVLLEMNSVDAETHWIEKAKQMTDDVIKHFYDPSSGFFFYTSDKDDKLFHRKIDISDNVIPSSNAVMAENLFKLSHFLDHSKYHDMALNMVNQLSEKMEQYPSNYSHWLALSQNITFPYFEFVATGKKSNEFLKEINAHYYTNVLIAGCLEDNDLPLYKNRFSETNNQIFICKDQTCLLPVNTVIEAIDLMKKQNNLR